MKLCCDCHCFISIGASLSLQKSYWQRKGSRFRKPPNTKCSQDTEHNPVKITPFSRNTYRGVWSFYVAIRRIQGNEPEAVMKVTSRFSTVCTNETW